MIAELDGVSESAVIAMADEQWGEVGLAYVVPAPGAALDPQAVIDHCRGRLARYTGAQEGGPGPGPAAHRLGQVAEEPAARTAGAGNGLIQARRARARA